MTLPVESATSSSLQVTMVAALAFLTVSAAHLLGLQQMPSVNTVSHVFHLLIPDVLIFLGIIALHQLATGNSNVVNPATRLLILIVHPLSRMGVLHFFFVLTVFEVFLLNNIRVVILFVVIVKVILFQLLMVVILFFLILIVQFRLCLMVIRV